MDGTFDDDRPQSGEGNSDDSVPYEFNMDDLYPDGVPENTADEGNTADTSQGGSVGKNELAQLEQEFNAQPQQEFEDELQGLLGNRAKAAVLNTQLVSADLLAAFCQLSDISAACLSDERGAVAVLRNLDGNAPEEAAKDLTTVVSGMPAILSVNRADKLESTLYVQGKAGQQKFPPPVLFSMVPSVTEDILLGISDADALEAGGEHVVDTSGLDRQKAIGIISDYTRFKPGRSEAE